ncbi:YacL family protein [Alishewanella tabrizica]|uniref:Uncharacterized protein n=1 Tax=Alishewanella tabrizica TaxID=671278 RepID=A0ABQ2WGW2_9ALTE|nr:YacL family protein [Alishewanella tabrizica]GGW55704.1 hypothetical protein GCM10008111_09810 [Alishewanella tabrizica]
MEYEFLYDRDNRRYRLALASEQAALQHFLMDEFEHNKASYQPLIAKLSAMTPFEDWQYLGREYSLLVQQQEVRICHNTLLSTEHFELPEQLADADLQLDEHLLESECGLADLLLLVQAWQDFLAT